MPTVQPLSADLIVRGLIIAAVVVAMALGLVLGVRALITGKATGSLIWGTMPEERGEADPKVLEALRERAELNRHRARREA